MEQNRIRQRERYTSDEAHSPHTRIANRETLDEEDDSDIWPTRMPSSTRRYYGLADIKTEDGHVAADVELPPMPRTPRAGNGRGRSAIPPRRSATRTDLPAIQPVQPSQRDIVRQTSSELAASQGSQRSQAQQRLRFHWLFFVGLAMLTMMIGWMALSTFTSWWQVTQDDWHYGRPRTFQTDYIVGHNDSTANPSHFIALNLNRHVEIIEFPGGDSSKARVYIGPTLIGPGQDLAVVTLTFVDVNYDGKVDMVVNVQDSHFAFINDNGTFRPARQGENIHL